MGRSRVHLGPFLLAERGDESGYGTSEERRWVCANIWLLWDFEWMGRAFFINERRAFWLWL